MSVDRFEYRDLALTVERCKVVQPSTVTLDWVTVDDEGDEHDSTLTLECTLLIDDVENCRELTISKISGPAAADFAEFAKFTGFAESAEVDEKGFYEEERLHDAANGLGRALLLSDYKDKLPTLFVRVLP